MPSLDNGGIIIDRSFGPWGNIVQDTWDVIDPIPADPDIGPTDRQIVLTAINETNNAGKIAGSEDGISYYFRRVPRDVNFRISADFYVNSFGFTGGRAELNGQEAFGFMARDWIPQHHQIPGTSADFRFEGRPGFDGQPDHYGRLNPDGLPKSDGAPFDLTEAGLKNIAWHQVYWNGQDTSLNDGVASSSNMIMVGGVKRGMRVYWRTGVTDPDGEKMPVSDFNSIANADFARFHFLPREFSDYSEWGSGISGTMSRPDFPTAGLTYRLYLEKTNSGFIARIEPPQGVGKGTTKNRVPACGFILEYSDRELPFPDLLCGPTSVERDFYYIGLFASRDAKVTVTNLRYEESPADMCPPRIDPEPEPIAPTFLVQSPRSTSAEDYTFYARSNIEGNLAISFNGGPTEVYEPEWIVEATNASARPFALFRISGIKLKEGDNLFDMVFMPDRRQERSGFLPLNPDGEEPRHSLYTGEFRLTDTRPLTRSFIVNRRALASSDYFPIAGNPQDKFAGCVYGPRIQREIIWVAPNGRAIGNGSREDPLDLRTAIAVSSVTPISGQVIMLKDGIYTPMSEPEVIEGSMRIPIRLQIPRFNSGRPNLTRLDSTNPNSPLKFPEPQPRPMHPSDGIPYPDPYADEYYRFFKVLKAENRDRAIIDFRKDLRNNGYAPRNMEVHGDFWIIDGIHVRNSDDTLNGLRISGQNILVRWVKTYFNGDTGLQISGRNDEPKAMWPANIRIEYCESFGNIDQARTNADGFAAKLTSWEGIVFYRCISHHNTDDAWDLFAKKETGPIGAVNIEQSFAYSNGRFLNDEIGRNFSQPGQLAKKSYSAGVGGNGFKVGGEGIPINHVIYNSLTWGNDGDGITSNSNPAIIVTHVTAFDNYNRTDTNPGSNFAIYSSSSPSYEGLAAIITQVLSWRSDPLGARNDRLEPRSPSSGFVWRNFLPANVAGSGRTDPDHEIYDGNNGRDSAILENFATGEKSWMLTGRSVSTLFINPTATYRQNNLRHTTSTASPFVTSNTTTVNDYRNSRVLDIDDFITDPKTLFSYGRISPTTFEYVDFRREIYYGGNITNIAEHVSPFGIEGDEPYRRLDGSRPAVERRRHQGQDVEVGLANRPDGRIHGDFLVIWDETNAPAHYYIGLPNLGNFMRLKEENFPGVLPGAIGLWD
jgi:hypothetical protein